MHRLLFSRIHPKKKLLFDSHIVLLKDSKNAHNFRCCSIVCLFSLSFSISHSPSLVIKVYVNIVMFSVHCYHTAQVRENIEQWLIIGFQIFWFQKKPQFLLFFEFGAIYSCWLFKGHIKHVQQNVTGHFIYARTFYRSLVLTTCISLLRTPSSTLLCYFFLLIEENTCNVCSLFFMAVNSHKP